MRKAGTDGLHNDVWLDLGTRCACARGVKNSVQIYVFQRAERVDEVLQVLGVFR